MKKNLTNLLWFCLIAFSITACKKDSDSNDSVSVKSLLIGKKWYLEKSESTFMGQTETNTPEACEVDNYTILNSNGTVTSGTGPKLCTGEESSGEENGGTWSLSADSKTLTFTESDCTEDCIQNFTIEKITSSSLIFSLTQTETFDNQTVTFTLRFYLKS